MSESPRLSPDEEQQSTVNLTAKREATVQPYGLTATLVAMLVLLIVRGLLPGWQLRNLMMLVLVVLFGTHFLLQLYQPRLPIYWLAILAAELGALFGLPVSLVYHPLQQPEGPINLLVWIILGIIGGVIVGRGLAAERYPRPVLIISFLSMFVISQFYTMLF